MLNIPQEVEAAERRIRPYILETPCLPSPELSESGTSEVLLKLENQQHTGSFKVRGAFNRLLSLSADELRRGIVTASTGNHGLAVAYALKTLSAPGTIFLPDAVAPTKRQKLAAYDVELKFHPGECDAVELLAREYAREHGLTYISPYNDPQIIGGQGTLGVELLRQLPAVDCVVVSVGGGGLISGIAGYLKSANPRVHVVGCLPENSPVMFESVKAGHIVEYESTETLSDGTAGGIEADSITFDPCCQLVDTWVTLSEQEIIEALGDLYNAHGIMVEGSAAMAAAAYRKTATDLDSKHVAILMCGGNIDAERFRDLVS